MHIVGFAVVSLRGWGTKRVEEGGDGAGRAVGCLKDGEESG